MQQAHLNRALKIASQSTCRKKHGVVVAKGRRVLAVAVNSYRNSPRLIGLEQDQRSYHAEINALKQLDSSDLSKCTLYSVRVSASGEAVMAKPCPPCMLAIKEAGIKEIIWS